MLQNQFSLASECLNNLKQIHSYYA